MSDNPITRRTISQRVRQWAIVSNRDYNAGPCYGVLWNRLFTAFDVYDLDDLVAQSSQPCSNARREALGCAPTPPPESDGTPLRPELLGEAIDWINDRIREATA